jgi:hypothetical protein
MVVGVRLETNLFDFNDFLILARFAFFFRLLVEELPIVHQSADWWLCVWCNLYQIQSALLGHLQCLRGWNDSNLLTLVVDEADLWHTDAPVDTCFLVSNRSSPDETTIEYQKPSIRMTRIGL